MLVVSMVLTIVSIFITGHYIDKYKDCKTEKEFLRQQNERLNKETAELDTFTNNLTKAYKELDKQQEDLLEQNDIHQTEVVALLAQLAKLRSDLFIKSRLEANGCSPDENVFYLYMCMPVNDDACYYGWELHMAYWDVFDVPVAINYNVDDLCELPTFFQTCLFKKLN